VLSSYFSRMQNLLIVTLIVFIINLPFGYWRGGLEKLTFWWFVAIHAPIPLVIGLRHLFELGFAPYTYAFILPSFIISQWLADRYRRGQLKDIYRKVLVKISFKS